LSVVSGQLSKRRTTDNGQLTTDSLLPFAFIGARFVARLIEMKDVQGGVLFGTLIFVSLFNSAAWRVAGCGYC
jgi:hypothetical protein